MVDDFRDEIEMDFDDFAVGPLDFNARLGERLRHLQAADYSAHAVAADRHDFDVVFPVEGLQSSESFSNFH